MSKDPNDPNELDLREQGLRDEGERLIAKLQQGGTPETTVLGPDGQPARIVQRELSQTEYAAQQASETVRRDKLRQMHEYLHSQLKDITAQDPTVLEACSTMLLAHKLLMWAKIEMASGFGVTDMLIDYADRKMKLVADNPEGFDVNVLLSQLRDSVIPFVEKRIKVYEQIVKKRGDRLRKMSRSLDGHKIASPFSSVHSKLEEGFRPGRVILFRGAYSAVRFALQECCRSHKKNNHCDAYYLSARSGERSGDWAKPIMPPAWWRGAGVEISTLNEVLKPVSSSDAILLVVEDLETLFPLTSDGAPLLVRLSFAIRRIYTWAQETGIAVILGDVIHKELKPEQLYSIVPYFEISAVRKDGEAMIKVDDEFYPANEEVFKE